MKDDKMMDATLIDSVCGYCALNNVPVSSLSSLTFLEVSKRLADTAQNNPKWIWASWEVRKYYEVCHSECHLKRIQALMSNGGFWEDGNGPNKQKSSAKIIEFPTNTTKH